MTEDVVFDECAFFYQFSKETEQIGEHTCTQNPTLHQIGEHTSTQSPSLLLTLEEKPGPESEEISVKLGHPVQNSDWNQRDNQPTSITTFLKYYVRKRNQKILNDSQPQALSSDVSTNSSNPAENLKKNIMVVQAEREDLPIALRKVATPL